ncbi:MAG: hypothetical protein QM754_17165 [Tepidisphaeraceae bacterium]
MSRYADWKAPKQDFATLVWPESSRLLADVSDNRRRLDAATAGVQNKPLSAWRHETRQALFGDLAKPVIATGHQIELYHPGVWIKNIVLDAVARKTGALALHIAVDTDSPKHLQLRWPGGAIDVSDDVLLHTGEWSGQVAQPSLGHLKKVRERFEKAAAEWSFRPSTPTIFESLEQSEQTADMLPQALLDACRRLDARLGLDYQVRRLSELTDLPAYYAFVHHIAGDIRAFASAYNSALDDYRREAGITTANRPMPPLRVEADSIELPFWSDRLDTGDRSRATVIFDNDRWHLLTEDAAFAFDKSLAGDEAAKKFGDFCRTHQLRLTPRALTLTMFMRLILVDGFVHGIGGGRYDQVTDRIIESYFSLPAPPFAVATGTLIFPDAGQRDAECVPCLMNEGHRLKHNVVEKQPYLATIASAPRKSRRTQAGVHRHARAVAERVARRGRLGGMAGETRPRHRPARPRSRAVRPRTLLRRPAA